MAKLRTCKICGKQYEYCGHCPSKNDIEPWRNLYCSENCRDSFEVMGNYSAGKINAADARTKLEGFGINVAKVRDIHKAVVMDIFRASVVVEQFVKAEELISESESILEPIVTTTEGSGEIQADGTGFKQTEDRPVFQKAFKKKQKKNIVNEDSN